MKTHTTHTSLALRSLALVPILALLVIACGKEDTEFVEIEETVIVVEEAPTNQKLIIVDPSDPEGNITINNEPHYYKIKGGKVSIYNKFGELQDFESQGYEIRTETEIVEVLENLTSKDIEEYNFLAKRHHEFIEKNGHVVLFDEDTRRMQTIFNSMNEEQRAENTPWPYINWETDIKAGQIPPPPPPVAPTQNPGYIKVDGKIYHYTLKKNDNNFYDRNGNIIDVYGKTVEYIKQEDLPPPPPAPVQDHGYIKVDGKIHYYTTTDGKKTFYNRWGAQIEVTGKTVEYVDPKDLPPPPPPADPIDYIENAGDKIHYYIDNVKVDAARAKEFIQKNGNKGIKIKPVNGVNSLNMFTKKLTSTSVNSEIIKELDEQFKKNGNSFIGDPIDVINIHKERYDYYVDGKELPHEDALYVLLKNEHWNASMQYINGKQSMIIKTYKAGAGPYLINNRGC